MTAKKSTKARFWAVGRSFASASTNYASYRLAFGPFESRDRAEEALAHLAGRAKCAEIVDRHPCCED